MFTQHQQSSDTGSPHLGSPIGSTATTVAASSLYSTAKPLAGKIALSDIPLGGTATITGISAHGELGRRLRDMGLMPGASVVLVSRAPLGDPLVVALDGCTLSVRCAEAACVIVAANQ